MNAQDDRWRYLHSVIRDELRYHDDIPLEPAALSGECLETPLITSPAVALNVCVHFRAEMSFQMAFKERACQSDLQYAS